ncbi:phosphatidic acid phosphatase type 2/haloperoxidase [Hysterangium stoloniferum]|nr:phosphatidic acid phosphatase type 2/haloperoxidase [Hysterangium stoloniferum]
MLLVLSALAPVILIPCICFLSCRSLWDLHHAWLGLAFSLSLTKVVTTLVKITVGRPRPDLISRCQPLAGSRENASWGFSDYTVCTQTDMKILRDGFRSFPSGHSSTAFSGLGFLTFYLIGKLALWDKCGYTWKAWLALLPVTIAAMIAISRTMDYRHHWEDVVIGSALGMMTAYFSYRHFFPSLADPASHQPFSRLKPSTVGLEGTEDENEPLTGRNRGEGV